jgi:hypothetical protein
MKAELLIIRSYVQAVLREWWVIVIEVVLVLTDVTERIFGTWLLPSSRIKVAIGLTALVVAQYRAYRKLYRQSQVPAQRPTELRIHEEPGSALYIQTPAGAALATASYFLFRLVVQNDGPESSVIRKFDLEVGEVQNFENLRPLRRNAVQTREGQMMMPSGNVLAESSLVVSAHNVWNGMLGFELEALALNSREIRCTLKITDANNSSAQHTFTLRVVG